MRRISALAFAIAASLAAAAPAAAIEQPAGAQRNMELKSSFPEAKYATAINFLQYGKGAKQRDVMVATGRFGLITYDLADPAHPRKLDTLENEALRLTGDPPSSLPGSTSSTSSTSSTYWQNEDMDVDQDRKLAFVARDPRSFGGTTRSDTSVAGVYIVDLRDPQDIELITFHQLPTGHTTTCVNGCDYLRTGGPASAVGQRPAWPGGRPIIVTDIRDPRNPKTSPQAVDLFRDDGVTAYSHDVQVDSAGIAWVSGAGGVRGYWTEGSRTSPRRTRPTGSCTTPRGPSAGRWPTARSRVTRRPAR